jgi:hypothetical protein
MLNWKVIPKLLFRNRAHPHTRRVYYHITGNDFVQAYICANNVAKALNFPGFHIGGAGSITGLVMWLVRLLLSILPLAISSDALYVVVPT